MRPFFLRLAVVGGLLAATAAVAQPPAGRVPAADAKKVKDDLEALLKDREKSSKDADAAGATDRDRLRSDLLKRLGELGNRSVAPPPEVSPKPKEVPPAKGPKGEPKPDPVADGTVPLDPLRGAQNLFKANQYEAAYRTLAMQKPDTLSPDDRTFAQYLSACCLRRMGKLPEAATVYREIADGKQDEFLTECSLWQLGEIRRTQELEGQLEQLRPKRKAK